MKKHLILAIKTFFIVWWIGLLIWFKWWDIYDFLWKYRTSESDIYKIVEKHNLYCEWDKLFWWKATDISWKYCSDFKWIEIKTKWFIPEC